MSTDFDKSKFMSYVLRHNPDKYGMDMDKQGWVSAQQMLQVLILEGHPTTLEKLKQLVSTNNKKRFEFSDDMLRIRASQGHSVKVDLGYKPQVPPDTLYHGTAERFEGSIAREGLKKQNRHHVHLSDNRDTAIAVGKRHGKPVLCLVNAKRMHEDGFSFTKSTNGVWLVDRVPTNYIIAFEYNNEK